MLEQLGWEFARQGLGYLIAILLSFVIVWMQSRIDKKDELIRVLQDRLLMDSKGYTDSYVSVAKEMIAASKDNSNALGLLQRSMDTLASTVQTYFINGRQK